MEEVSTVREKITDAIRYWEPMRILYNAVLTFIVVLVFAANYPDSRKSLDISLALIVFILAVLANVAYCAAYGVDLFVQFSGYWDIRKEIRRVIFTIGCLFAGAITFFYTFVFFGSHY